MADLELLHSDLAGIADQLADIAELLVVIATMQSGQQHQHGGALQQLTAIQRRRGG